MAANVIWTLLYYPQSAQQATMWFKPYYIRHSPLNVSALHGVVVHKRHFESSSATIESSLTIAVDASVLHYRTVWSSWQESNC